MKSKLLILLFIACLLPISAISQQTDPNDNGEWYPFVIPEKLDPNSPMNIGKLVLDPPAGKHGFCKVKDGHFYFEDGTRAKFWGTNLCMGACFPTHEEAEMLAERIAFFGFNAVRLHHMDFYFEPRGIFEDVAPGQKDPQKKKTGVLSKKQLEKLDFLIYQLKLRGIYINMNLLVSRHFTLADGVTDAEKLNKAAKPVSLFDPKLIALQKKYANELLSHYNSYTNLSYRDDPAIALIEIANENTLENKISNKIPRFYLEQLKKKYADWKKTNSGTEQEFYTSLESQYFQLMSSFLKHDINVKIPVTGSQFASYETQDSCDYFDAHTYWDPPKFPSNIWNRNNFTVHNKSALQDKNHGIIGMIYEADLKRKKASPSKPITISEWNHCFPNKFSYESPLLLSAEASKNEWDGFFLFAFSHGWKDTPVYNVITSFFDAIADSQKLIASAVAGLIFNSNNPITSSTHKGTVNIISNHIVGSCGALKDKIINLNVFDATVSDNGVIVLFSNDGKPLETSQHLLFVAISEIKNSGSKWENDKFLWGGTPTMLKKLVINLNNKNNRNYSIFELTSDGKRGRKILLQSLGTFCLDAKTPWLEIIAE